MVGITIEMKRCPNIR